MAASHHSRSNSSPPAPHPLAGEVDEYLNRLRSCESASSSSSSICQGLNCLHDLYFRIDSLLQLPLVQQSLSQEQSKRCIEERFDGFLRLLEACNIAKDALSQTKESLHEIQSSMRRKRSAETEAKKFFASRKSFKKSFGKVLKGLTVADRTCILSSDNETLSVLKEAETFAASLYDSIFCFISGSKLQERVCSRWALVSKLTSRKRIACEEERADVNEFAKVDAALHSLINRKSGTSLKLEDLQCLEMCIQDLDLGLERLFKSLIKVRVSVLNIVGH